MAAITPFIPNVQARSDIHAESIATRSVPNLAWPCTCYVPSYLVHHPSSVQLHAVQGYQLGPSQLDFAITATVTSTKADGSALVETLILDPSTPYVLDDANLVSVQLLGDLLTYTALPVFTDTYLMVPSPTGTS